jgi:manganese-transporting P-type ATPase
VDVTSACSLITTLTHSPTTQGLPFRESIFRNRTLIYSLLMVSGIAVLAALEVSQELNDTMQLVPFPGDYSLKLLSCMAADFLGALCVETVCHYLFSNNRPRAELFPR